MTMADEKPKKPQKTATTTRAPRKRASSPHSGDATSRDATSRDATTNANGPMRNAETPMLAIEQSSEVARSVSDELDEIRRQAYALYLSRGGGDGSDLSDWLEAERIVRLRHSGSESADRNQR
jgi:DUF2934 family protein